ncbi:hypothetical protein BV25DRAFT_707457 [Artomyces pyxidatus]|uniref:Uncharacterized protein n=1 Tax=Artomyces pyxidatus TaxID=48021 RepID=A0ACB8SZI1_9AGAM|nr:hypothetical protein BV25DRAFT_707457 [Artomyces pyxidatus]
MLDATTHRPQCTAMSLPNELLLIIFSICVTSSASHPSPEVPQATDLGTSPKALALSHVCHRWRSIITSTPTFWTRVEVFPAPKYVHMVPSCVKYSRSLPLDIIIRPPSGVSSSDHGNDLAQHKNKENVLSSSSVSANTVTDIDSPKFKKRRRCLRDTLAFLSPHVSRWSSFSLVAEHASLVSYVVSHLAKLPSAPILRTLALSLKHEDRVLVQPFHLHVPFHGNAPQLETILLDAVGFD